MVIVAMEQYFPEAERIVTDNLALPILPFGYRAEVKLLWPFTKWIIKKSEQKVPGLWGSIVSRKRYIDDRLSVDAGQIEAVVNLGQSNGLCVRKSSDRGGEISLRFHSRMQGIPVLQ